MKYGALPPDHLKWQIGKTAASIAFVEEAEGELIHSEISDKDREIINRLILDIKTGQLILDNFQTVYKIVEQFSRSLEM